MRSQAGRSCVRRRRPPGRDRGGHDSARRSRCCASATVGGPYRWPRPRTTSGSATATSVPTPAAWGRTRRCRPSMPPKAERLTEPLVAPTLHELRRRGHRLPRRALRRADADAGRPQGARVQRALRRPRDPGRAAPLDGRRAAILAACAAGSLRHATDLRRRCRRDGGVRDRGLPEAPRTGDRIEGLAARRPPCLGSTVSSPRAWPRAATAALVTAGGRVLDVTGLGATVAEARVPGLRGGRRPQLARHAGADRHRRRGSDRADPAVDRPDWAVRSGGLGGFEQAVDEVLRAALDVVTADGHATDDVARRWPARCH